jgi:hypothetical protein
VAVVDLEVPRIGEQRTFGIRWNTCAAPDHETVECPIGEGRGGLETVVYSVEPEHGASRHGVEDTCRLTTNGGL